MEAQVALNVTPLNAPHKDLELLPLADRDYLIQDLVGNRSHLQTFCELKNSYLSNSDFYGIWESNLPIYFLPFVNVFHEIIHLSSENCETTQRAVKIPSGTILFHITPDSINQMLNFKPTQLLFPLSMKFLLDEGPKLFSSEISIISQVFMRAGRQPIQPPPFNYTCFNEVGRLLVDMISYVLGFKTSEHIDENILVILSTFTPGQTPAIKYIYAKFLANKIHDQLLNLDREGVFKY